MIAPRRVTYAGGARREVRLEQLREPQDAAQAQAWEAAREANVQYAPRSVIPRQGDSSYRAWLLLAFVVGIVVGVALTY